MPKKGKVHAKKASQRGQVRRRAKRKPAVRRQPNHDTVEHAITLHIAQAEAPEGRNWPVHEGGLMGMPPKVETSSWGSTLAGIGGGLLVLAATTFLLFWILSRILT
jgi:hypothetical protein